MLSRPGFLSHVPTTCGVGSRPPRYRPRLDALTGPDSRPDALACATRYETTGAYVRHGARAPPCATRADSTPVPEVQRVFGHSLVGRGVTRVPT